MCVFHLVNLIWIFIHRQNIYRQKGLWAVKVFISYEHSWIIEFIMIKRSVEVLYFPYEFLMLFNRINASKVFVCQGFCLIIVKLNCSYRVFSFIEYFLMTSRLIIWSHFYWLLKINRWLIWFQKFYLKLIFRNVFWYNYLWFDWMIIDSILRREQNEL